MTLAKIIRQRDIKFEDVSFFHVLAYISKNKTAREQKIIDSIEGIAAGKSSREIGHDVLEYSCVFTETRGERYINSFHIVFRYKIESTNFQKVIFFFEIRDNAGRNYFEHNKTEMQLNYKCINCNKKQKHLIIIYKELSDIITKLICQICYYETKHSLFSPAS